MPLALYDGAGDLNSGPQACAANSLTHLVISIVQERGKLVLDW